MDYAVSKALQRSRQIAVGELTGLAALTYICRSCWRAEILRANYTYSDVEGGEIVERVTGAFRVQRALRYGTG